MSFILVADFHTVVPQRNGEVVKIELPKEEYPVLERRGGVGISVSVTFNGAEAELSQDYCDTVCNELEKIKAQLKGIISGSKPVQVIEEQLTH